MKKMAAIEYADFEKSGQLFQGRISRDENHLTSPENEFNLLRPVSVHQARVQLETFASEE